MFAAVATDNGDKYVATLLDTDLMPGSMQALIKKEAALLEQGIDRLHIEAERRFGAGSWAARFLSGSGDAEHLEGLHLADDAPSTGSPATHEAVSRPKDLAEKQGARRAKAKRDGEELHDGLLDDLEELDEDEIRADDARSRGARGRTGAPTGKSAGLRTPPGTSTPPVSDAAAADDPDDDDGLAGFMARNGL